MLQVRRVSLLVLGLLLLALVLVLASRDDLFSALDKGDLDKVKKLVEGGCDVNQKYAEGTTVLHLVGERHYIRGGQKPVPMRELGEIAEYLIAHGADVDARDELQHTPLHLASMLNNFEVVKVLIDNGADVNAKNAEGQTPLHLHTRGSYTGWESGKILIDNGANLNAQDENGETPLHYLTLRGEPNIELAEYMIRRGAEINIPNKNGNTALHYAARFARIDTIDMLLFLIKNGGNLRIENKEGHCPLDVAPRKVREKVTKILDVQEVKAP